MQDRSDGSPRRRVSISRRRLVTVASTTVAAAVAGCSGGGGGDGGDGEDGGDGGDGGDGSTDGGDSGGGDGTDGTSDGGTANGTSGGTTGATGSLSSSIDGIDLVSARYTDTGIEGRYPVTVTVENTGDQETNVKEYDYEYTVFDGNGADITAGSGGPIADIGTAAPGESVEVLFTASVDGVPEDVASFEVTVSCESDVGSAAYCGDSGTGGDGTTTSGDGGDISVDGLRTPGPGDDHDWAAIADRDVAGTFDLPDAAPSGGWGFQRINNELTLFVPPDFESGTVYFVFVTDGSVSQVLVLEPSFQGEQLVIGPTDSAYAMDTQNVGQISVAWQGEGDLYVVEKFSEYL